MKQSYFSNRRLTRDNKGFSLVELIVVIAIMAILAGVGVAGYTKYIEHANKQADMTTVGNIERAIDIGAYSLAYEMDDALQLSENGIQYPLGFIVLTQEGGSIIESGSEVTTDTTPCKIVEGTFTKATPYTYTYKGGFLNLVTYTVTAYVIEGTETLSYCETHSRNVATADVYVGSSTSDKNAHKNATQSLKISSNCDLVLNHTEGEQRKSYSGTFAEKADTAMGEILAAAYGSDYANTLKLKYDGWTDSTVPSFFSTSTESWNTIKTLTGVIDNLGISQSGSLLGQQLIEGGHDNAADMMVNIATRMADLGEETFLQKWAEVDASDGTTRHYFESYDFGLAGREYYSAARSAYNAAFAGYVEANSSASEHTDGKKNDHIAAIRNYGSISIGDLTLPQTICRGAFELSDTNLHSGVKSCETCKRLYEEYAGSDASVSNAKSVFATMESVKETGADVLGQYGNSGFFNYYEKYLNEVSGLYSAAQDAAGSNSIVISVYLEDGKIVYDVSPKAADPRNKAD